MWWSGRLGGLGSAIYGPREGWMDLLGTTLLALGLTWGLLGSQGGVVLGGVASVSALQGAWCMKRMGGITGDTMGANSEGCETRVFLVLLGLGEG